MAVFWQLSLPRYSQYPKDSLTGTFDQLASERNGTIREFHQYGWSILLDHSSVIAKILEVAKYSGDLQQSQG